MLIFPAMLNILLITCLTVLVSLLARFILTLMQKWGILEWLQSRANPFFYKMLTCPFCRTWWTCVAICLVGYLVSGYGWILIVPFFATTLGEE